MASLPNTVCPPPLYYYRPSESSQNVPEGRKEQLNLYRHCSPSIYDASATSLHWEAIVGRPSSIIASPPSKDEHGGPQRSASGSSDRPKRLPVLLALAREILSLQEEEEFNAFEGERGMGNEAVSSQTSSSIGECRVKDKEDAFVRDCCAGVKGSSRKRVVNKTYDVRRDRADSRRWQHKAAAPASCHCSPTQPQEGKSNVANRLPCSRTSNKTSRHYHRPLHPCDKIRTNRSSSSNSHDHLPLKSRPCNSRTKSNFGCSSIQHHGNKATKSSSSSSSITQHHSKSSIVVHMPKTTTPSQRREHNQREKGKGSGVVSNETASGDFMAVRERANAVKTLLNELDGENDEEEEKEKDAAASIISSVVSLGSSGSGVTKTISLHDVRIGVGLAGIGGRGGASSLLFTLEDSASGTADRDSETSPSTSCVDVDGAGSTVQGEGVGTGGDGSSPSEDDIGEVARSEAGCSDADEEIAESLESGYDDYSEDFTSESSSSS